LHRPASLSRIQAFIQEDTLPPWKVRLSQGSNEGENLYLNKNSQSILTVTNGGKHFAIGVVEERFSKTIEGESAKSNEAAPQTNRQKRGATRFYLRQTWPWRMVLGMPRRPRNAPGGFV
jgi:hypothetical protein